MFRFSILSGKYLAELFYRLKVGITTAEHAQTTYLHISMFSIATNRLWVPLLWIHWNGSTLTVSLHVLFSKIIPTSFFLPSHLCFMTQQLTFMHNIRCLLSKHSKLSYSVSWKSNDSVRREAGQTSQRPVAVLALALCGYQGNENSKLPLSASEFPPLPPRWIRATRRRHSWSKHR